MTKYLITGGSGFIGSNLVRSLVLGKNDIFLIVEKNADLWRIKDIMPVLKIFEADLADKDSINNIVNLVRPNIIFHLASYGGLPTQTEQHKIFDINFYGTVNLVSACKQVGFDCFINTGSSSEYGIKDTQMRESDVVWPVSDYGVAKAAATQFCVKEALFNKLPIYTVRPFSVYGDYEMPGRLIPSILLGALQKTKINLSFAAFVRDFIYVDDIVDIYLKIAQVKPEKHFVFNAGTGVQSSIGDVIDVVESIINAKLDVCWNSSEARPWEPKVWKADIDRALNLLNWQPSYSLKEGLKKSLEWFKKNLHFYSKNYENTSTKQTQSVSL